MIAITASIASPYQEAVRLAEQGYGWQDILVRTRHRISERAARDIVWSVARKRLEISRQTCEGLS